MEVDASTKAQQYIFSFIYKKLYIPLLVINFIQFYISVIKHTWN